MELQQKLESIFARYEKDVVKAAKEASPFGGMLGFGGGVKNDPCHVRFYEDVTQWAQEAEGSGAGEETLFAAVEYVLCNAVDCSPRNETYGMRIAVHGCVKPLIPLLTQEHRRALKATYEANYPKRMRLPVQNQIVKLLGE